MFTVFWNTVENVCLFSPFQAFIYLEMRIFVKYKTNSFVLEPVRIIGTQLFVIEESQGQL